MCNENLTQLSDGNYLVRTQAGFNKLVKILCEKYDYEKHVVFGYPDKYPSVISIEHGYRGYHYINLSCSYVNKYRETLQNTLEDLKDV